jgi:hypothetical protein
MTRRITTALIILFLVFAFNNSPYAEPKNYCHDEESWKEWDALVEKNPNDMEVQALHALRIGLCTRAVFDRYHIVDENDLKMAAKTQHEYLEAKMGTIWAQSPISKVFEKKRA